MDTNIDSVDKMMYYWDNKRKYKGEQKDDYRGNEYKKLSPDPSAVLLNIEFLKTHHLT